jgi:CrcB protein
VVRTQIDPGQEWRFFLTTGLLGGLTTFSAFSLEVALMVERNAYAMAAAYVLISVTGSVAGLFIGLISMRHFT